MLKKFLRIILLYLFLVFTVTYAHALEYKLLIVPDGLYNTCENYYCFPAASEILANYINDDFYNFKYINTIPLQDLRSRLTNNQELNIELKNYLNNYRNNNKIDFTILKKLSKEFNVKSMVLIRTYVITPQSNYKRNLWEAIELSSAFRFSNQLNLVTEITLLDNVNDVIIWDDKYVKEINSFNNIYENLNMTEAFSQKEKISQYYKEIVSKNTTNNINRILLRKCIRTVDLHNSTKDVEMNTLKFLNTEKHFQPTSDNASTDFEVLNEDSFSL